MSMEELLQALMGGGSAPRRSSASSGDPLADMLQGMLGGGAADAQSGGLGDILGAILGGGATEQGSSAQGAEGGLMDILGAILGGSSGMQGPGSSPIVEGIAGKLGLPQGIAQMIVAFVLGKLASGMLGGGAASLPDASRQPGGRSASPQQPQSANLDSLLESMGQDSSMADELAQQTGLDAETAQRGLQEVLGMIGAQSGGASAPPKQGGLDDLLDSW